MQSTTVLAQPSPGALQPVGSSPKAVEKLQQLQHELTRLMSMSKQSKSPAAAPPVLPLSVLTATPSIDALLQRKASGKHREDVSDINADGSLNLMDPVRSTPLTGWGPSPRPSILGSELMTALQQHAHKEAAETTTEAPQDEPAVTSPAAASAPRELPPTPFTAPSPAVEQAPTSAITDGEAQPSASTADPAADLAPEQSDPAASTAQPPAKYNPWTDDAQPAEPEPASSPRSSPWDTALATALADLEGVKALTGVPLDTSDPHTAVAQLQQQIDALKQQHTRQLAAADPQSSAPDEYNAYDDPGPVSFLAPLASDVPIVELKRANLRRSTSSSQNSSLVSTQSHPQAGGPGAEQPGSLLPRMLSRNRSSAARLGDAPLTSPITKIEGPRGAFSFARLASFGSMNSKSSQTLVRQGSRRGAYPDFQSGRRATDSDGGGALMKPPPPSPSSQRHSHTSGQVDQPWDASAVSARPATLQRSQTYVAGNRVDEVEAGNITISGPHAPPSLMRSMTAGHMTTSAAAAAAAAVAATDAPGPSAQPPITSVAQALAMQSPGFLPNGAQGKLSPLAKPTLDVQGLNASELSDSEVAATPSGRVPLPSPLPPHPEEDEEEGEEGVVQPEPEPEPEPSQDGSCKVAASVPLSAAAAVATSDNKPGVEVLPDTLTAADQHLVTADQELPAAASAVTPEQVAAAVFPATTQAVSDAVQQGEQVDATQLAPATAGEVLAAVADNSLAPADNTITTASTIMNGVTASATSVPAAALPQRDASVGGWLPDQQAHPAPAASSTATSPLVTAANGHSAAPVAVTAAAAAAAAPEAIPQVTTTSSPPPGSPSTALATPTAPPSSPSTSIPAAVGGSPRGNRSPLRASVVSHQIDPAQKVALASHQIPLDVPPAAITPALSPAPTGSPKAALSLPNAALTSPPPQGTPGSPAGAGDAPDAALSSPVGAVSSRRGTPSSPKMAVSSHEIQMP